MKFADSNFEIIDNWGEFLMRKCQRSEYDKDKLKEIKVSFLRVNRLGQVTALVRRTAPKDRLRMNDC